MYLTPEQGGGCGLLARPRGLQVLSCWIAAKTEGLGHLQITVNSMDQITIKTPNPKCRLNWCLIQCCGSGSGIRDPVPF